MHLSAFYPRKPARSGSHGATLHSTSTSCFVPCYTLLICEVSPTQSTVCTATQVSLQHCFASQYLNLSRLTTQAACTCRLMTVLHQTAHHHTDFAHAAVCRPNSVALRTISGLRFHHAELCGPGFIHMPVAARNNKASCSHAVFR